MNGLRLAVGLSLNLLILALVLALWAGAPLAAFFAPSPVVIVEERVETSKTVETSVNLHDVAPSSDPSRSLARSRPGRGEPQRPRLQATPSRNALRAAPLVVRLRL